MANKFRIVRGPTRPIPLPGYATDAVEVGDLLFYDSTNDAARPASAVPGVTIAAKQTAFALAFAGVALSAKTATESRNVLVGTDGDYLFDAPTGAGTDGSPLDHVAAGNGTTMTDQEVNVNGVAAADSIGRLLKAKATTDDTALIRIASQFGRVETEAAAAEESSVAAEESSASE